MYIKFRDFKEQRDLSNFAYRLDDLCSQIEDFREFWLHVGLPVVLEGNYETEEELLEAWVERLKNLWGKTQNAFKGAGVGGVTGAALGAPLGGIAGGMTAGPIGILPGMQAGAIGGSALGAAAGGLFGNKRPNNNPQSTNPPNNNPQSAQPKPLSQQTQERAKEVTKSIKQALSQTMQNIVQNYRNSQDSIGYQVASKAADKISAVVDGFSFKRGEKTFDRNAVFGAKGVSGENGTMQANTTIPPQISRSTTGSTPNQEFSNAAGAINTENSPNQEFSNAAGAINTDIPSQLSRVNTQEINPNKQQQSKTRNLSTPQTNTNAWVRD